MIMEDSRRYPIGQQDFRELRENGSFYVDKTSFIEKLVCNSSRYYFLARPRRFGKSLFLSTLQYFYEGERHLFKGLFIDNVDWEWKRYPVLRLDLNIEKYEEPGMLDKALNNRFMQWEREYGIDIVAETLSSRFANIIREAHRKTGLGVVVLVDEYDKPLVGNLHHDLNFEYYRTKLASLYSNFKSSAEHIQLVFLTGVSRFSKLSIFSDLNNLNDITFDNDFADICGITQAELLGNFHDGIGNLASENGISYTEACEELKKNYDGYRFAKRGSDIYNPWSVLNCLSKRDISYYWSRTGKPTLIAETIYDFNEDIADLLNSQCDETTLSGFDLKSASPLALLYQTGYLTIKDYDNATRLFRLGVPNREVAESLFRELLPFYVKVKSGGDTETVVRNIIYDLLRGEPEKFVRHLDIFLAGIPYDMKMENENNLHAAIYILLTLIGVRTETEVRTSNGRIDLVVKTPGFIYIIELKFGHTAEEALAQISDKQYALPYAGDSRRIFKIGISYSRQTRRLDSSIIEEIR